LAPQRIAQVISKQVVDTQAITKADSKLALNILAIAKAVNIPAVDIQTARRLTIDTERALVLHTLTLILIILKTS
jgi:hypothetical protein